jgi:uncharacterized cupin superfamily protein
VDDFVLRRWDLAHFPGDQAPPHIHHRSDEAFCVVRGRLEVLVGDRRQILQAGDHVRIPAGTVHTFATVDPDGADVVVVMTPEVDELVTALHRASTDAERADAWARHHSEVVDGHHQPAADHP